MDLKRLLYLFAIAASITLIMRTFIFESIYIASGSMEPRLPVGAHVFMDKITLNFRDPQRDDIIVFVSPVDAKEELVKRVIAIGGDTIELKEKSVILNGKTVNDDYAKHTRRKEELTGDSIPEIKVPPGHIFVLGDNRDESNDSSVWRNPNTNQPVYFVPLSKVRGLVRGFY